MNYLPNMTEAVARGLRAMKDTPDIFLYVTEDGWFDGAEILGIPVYNAPQSVTVCVSGDEECPFVPIWHGEPTAEIDMKVRAFQLGYANTGDFPS